MIPFHQVEEKIPDATAFVAILTTAAAFALSFSNLQAAAVQAGIPHLLAWLWPLCVDAVLIGGSLMILRSSLRNESAKVGWLILLSFTGISTGFNIVHSPDDLFSRVAHAVPPIALCVSIEMLMLNIRSDLVRASCTTPDKPDDQSSPCTTHSPVQDQGADHTVHHQEEDIPAVVSDQDEDRGTTPQIVTDEEIIEIYRASPGISFTKASEQVGCSRSTVSRRVKTLVERGLLGPEVIPGYVG